MINIPKHIYIGYDAGSANPTYDLPEAEIVPWGETTGEKKKLDSIAKNNKQLFEYENIPLPGFTLYTSDRKSWGSLDQSWLVIDPRGFLGRITTRNLESILHVTGITQDLIQEKCVWAREDSQTKLSLVPVSSSLYLEAVKNTELIEGRINIKDVEIGDTVLMQNKMQGIFRGTLSLYGPLYDNQKDLAPQVFLRRQIVELEGNKFYYQTDARILKVLKKRDSEISKEMSASYLNNAILNNACFSSSGYFGRHLSSKGIIKLVSANAVPAPTLTLEEITDYNEITQLFHFSMQNRDSGQLMLEISPTKRYVIEFPYNFGNGVSPTTINSFDVIPARLDDKKEKIILDESRISAFKTKQRSGIYSLDKFKKFYKIVKHVKNQNYV